MFSEGLTLLVTLLLVMKHERDVARVRTMGVKRHFH